MTSFPVAIAVFVFNRDDLTRQVLRQLALVCPSKLYIISDGPRTEQEKLLVEQTRSVVDEVVDWECDIVRCYREDNVGVYHNLTGGIEFVLSREEQAIFLEDDNLPELSFFQFAHEMLQKYEAEDSVLWVCGTNYLEDVSSQTGDSYFFTRNLQPCGWATWSSKFLKYYDKNLCDLDKVEEVATSYLNKELFEQQYFSWRKTKHLVENDNRRASWDHQMSFCLRRHGLFGVVPVYNQIRNIGVDSRSTHGGSSMLKPMTYRFTRMGTSNLRFPLRHPQKIGINEELERRLEKVILMPAYLRQVVTAIRMTKRLFGISEFEPFKWR